MPNKKMQLKYHRIFEKQYAKLSLSLRSKVDVALLLFKKNPLDRVLHNHSLKGKLEGRRSIAAAFDLRLIFTVEGDYVVVQFLEVGTHNQVY